MSCETMPSPIKLIGSNLVRARLSSEGFLFAFWHTFLPFVLYIMNSRLDMMMSPCKSSKENRGHSVDSDRAAEQRMPHRPSCKGAS